jgi:hypothetical protein
MLPPLAARCSLGLVVRHVERPETKAGSRPVPEGTGTLADPPGGRGPEGPAFPGIGWPETRPEGRAAGRLWWGPEGPRLRRRCRPPEGKLHQFVGPFHRSARFPTGRCVLRRARPDRPAGAPERVPARPDRQPESRPPVPLLARPERRPSHPPDPSRPPKQSFRHGLRAALASPQGDPLCWLAASAPAFPKERWLRPDAVLRSHRGPTEVEARASPKARSRPEGLVLASAPKS